MLMCRTADKPVDDDRAPAPFVVGVMRSGTTLLRLMLDAHPELAIPGETWFIPEIAKACRESPDPRATFLTTLTGQQRWPIFQVDERQLAERLAGINPFDVGAAFRAFYQLYAQRLGKTRWGDKSPSYLKHMRLIQSLLPEARFIHLIRDGRDVASSIAKLRETNDPDAIANSAVTWMLQIAAARDQAEELDYYLEIRYEDLIRDTATTLRRVASFLDLPWNPTMLDYHLRTEERMGEYRSAPRELLDRRGGDPLVHHRLSSEPPQVARVDAWRRDMSEAEQRRFVDIAGDTLREFGYSLDVADNPAPGVPGEPEASV